uniref:Odorant receptor n=1 Tax=Aulacocentrum confusum TaxID=2767324 RepID=A0A7G8Z975_9HYME|nr:olfactory receptor 56 [Aulacocentrum confusum]
MVKPNLILFRQSQWFLQVLNILPKNFWKTAMHYYFSIIMRIVQVTILIIIIAANTMHMLKRVTDKKERILIFGPIIFNIMNLLKLFSIYYRSSAIIKCLEHMTVDWTEIKNEEDKKIMIDNMQWGERLTFLCASVMYSGAVGYVVIMPLTVHMLTRNERNISMRVPIFPGYDVAFEAQHTPVYEAVMITYFYSAFILYSILIFSNHLAIQFVQHARGQLQIIKRNFNILGRNSNDCKIADLINRHVRVSKFAILLKQVLHEICLTDVIFTTLTICMCEYSVLQMWRNNDMVSVIIYVIMTLVMCLSPLMFCWLSEIMEKQFTDITQIYMTSWYNFNGQNYIVLIILIAQVSRKINAGIMDMSFESFAKVRIF